jgi:hypothetical protein
MLYQCTRQVILLIQKLHEMEWFILFIQIQKPLTNWCHYFCLNFNNFDNRCSRSGSVFFVYGNLVSWSSKRQKYISQSTTEAEYVAASDACKEAVWLSSLLAELGETEKKPVPMFCDNQSAIQSIRNPVHPQSNISSKNKTHRHPLSLHPISTRK